MRPLLDAHLYNWLAYNWLAGIRRLSADVLSRRRVPLAFASALSSWRRLPEKPSPGVIKQLEPGFVCVSAESADDLFPCAVLRRQCELSRQDARNHRRRPEGA